MSSNKITVGSINTDAQASAAAAIIRGDRTPAQKREDAYNAPPQRPDPEDEAKKEILDALKEANESNTVRDLDYALYMIMNFKEKYYASQSTKFRGKYSTEITRLEKITMDKMEDMEFAPGNATEWESKYSNWRRESDSDDESGGVSAAAMSAPPSVDMTQWNGPTMSRTYNKPYYTRKSDGLAVWGDRNTGELTQARIDEAVARKAKKEAAKKAAKKGGRRRTRKKRGKGKKKKRNPPKSKKKRDTTKERLDKARKAAKKKQADRIAGLRQSALVVPDDGLEHSDDFAAGIFNPNAPDEDEFVASIGLPPQEVVEGAASAAAVDDYGRDWGQFSSEGGGRKTRKMKGGHHLYKRLGVSKYASQKQIKKAYNKLKKKKKLTKKVKYAYKILSKKKSRKKYNAKYKKHKKSKRKKKGGIPHAIIKAQVWPSGYTPEPEIANPQAFREPTWMRQL